MNLSERVASLPPEKRLLFERLSQRARIEPSPDAADAPLSFEQERLWFLHQLEPDDPSYHLHMHLPLPRELDLARLTSAWHRTIDRHPSLRTTFPLRDGVPVQHVCDGGELDIPTHRLAALPVSERGTAAARIAREQAEQPFDLARGPLLRLALIELPDQWVNLITVHHIVADGWSIDVLMRDLDAAYQSLLRGVPAQLPDLAVHFTDFARWQRTQLTGVRLDSLLAFWSAYLEDAPPLQLPVDRPAPEIYSSRGGVRMRPLSPHTIARLDELARREGCTLFQVLLTAYAVLLHRYSGQTDLVFGTPVANRELPQVEELVGFFLNTILLRVRLEPDQTFKEVLAAVRESTAAAYSHQQLPFARLVQHLQPQRDLRRNPLYQATFQLLQSRHRSASIDAELDDVGYRRTATNTDLAFDLLSNGREILCRAEYRLDIFDDATIERLLDYWERLLDAVADQSAGTIATLRLTNGAERALLLDEFAGSGSLAAVPGWRFAGTTDRPALTHARGVLSYRELDDLVGRLAAFLSRRGAGPETVVGLEIEDPLETIVAILGCWRAGAAYAYVDPQLPEQRRALLRDNLAAAAILEEAGDWRRQLAGESPLAGQPIPAHRLAAVIYTSGSTGVPKGVMIEHGALARQLDWLRDEIGVGPEDVVLQKYSFGFDAALSELLAGLATGATLVVDDARGLDADHLLALVRQYDVTVLDVVPSQLAVLVAHAEWPHCTSLRIIVCGGERLTRELADRAVRSLPGVRLVNAYGPTEATITATWWGYEAGTPDPPIGSPISGTRAYVLDPAREPVPVGMQGQLYLGGCGLARGYWNDAPGTARRFVDNPFGPDRLYATGDRARFLSNGVIEYRGRTDEQIKLRGVRIELGEIEQALAAHPAVRECAVALQSVHAVSAEEMAVDEWRLNQLSAPEAEFLYEFERGSSETRRRTMWRTTSEFNLYLHVQQPEFMACPTPAQRNWLLQRALDEAEDDLRVLDDTARRCVRGSVRPSITGPWNESPAARSPDQLVIAGQQVMHAWERPLMRCMAEIAAATHGNIAEIGFGMGISATFVQELGVRSHTIVECHPGVLESLQTWRAGRTCVEVVPRRWQEWQAPDGSFDAILFDTYPTNEDEYLSEVIVSPTFAASFFPTAARLLRPGGVFTYYTNEIDSLPRRHQRLLLEHFSTFSVRLVRGLEPPPDCQYWWADSMAVVQAVK